MKNYHSIDFETFNLINAIVIMLDESGKVVAANSSASQALGLPVESIVGKDWFMQFIPINEQSLVRTVFEQILNNEISSIDVFENNIIGFNDQKRLIHWRNTAIKNTQGDIVRILSIGEDITDKRQKEINLTLAASVFTHAQEGIIITDSRGVIKDINESFIRITGYSREEAIGKTPKLLQSGKHDARFYRQMWQGLAQKGVWKGEVINRRKDGSLWIELLTITSVRDAEHQISHYLAFFTDITALKEKQEHIIDLAFHDALTHLPNRTLLAERLHQAMKVTLEQHKLLAVCYLDLDSFKPINDQFGHEHGDNLLIAVANKLQYIVHENDTVARLGGDEFVLLLTNHGSIDEITAHLADMIFALNKHYSVDGQEHQVTLSIGVAIYPDDSSDADTLLRHADHAMYQAKRDGRNRYHLFDQEKDKQAQKQRTQVERFARAIANNELCLYFQPKVNMHTGIVLGAEALVRWQHPEQGLLPPSAFLPFIEHSDLMPNLDKWVLNRAFTHIDEWRRDGGVSIHVSINISASSLQDLAFVEYLKHLFDLFKLVEPKQIELEVLESSAVHDLSAAAHVVEACNHLGVSFALDDFGTGYSSLTYLRRLSANTLKIDQSFVRDMLSDSEDLAIVQGVIALAHAFELSVVAEGVETAAHGSMLLQLGCPIAQGYGIARPIPAIELLNWIKQFEPSPLWQSVNALVLMAHDLPLITAEIDHQTWISKLIHYLNGTEPHLPIGLDEHSCRFGRWYDNAGQENYGNLIAFQEINAIHIQFHDIAHTCLTQYQQKNKLESELLGELMRLRQLMLAALHKLQLAVSTMNKNNHKK